MSANLLSPEKIIYPQLSYQLNGILFDVRKYLGKYCNEMQYSDAVEGELKRNEIIHKREHILLPCFDDEHSGRNKVDFLIEDIVILEIKAKQFLTKEDYFQVRRYLQAADLKLGILVNFRQHIIYPKRILNSEATT